MEYLSSYEQQFKCGQKKEIVIAQCSCGSEKHIQRQRFDKLKPHATCGSCPPPNKVFYAALNDNGDYMKTFEVQEYEAATDYSRITGTRLVRVTYSSIFFPVSTPLKNN